MSNITKSKGFFLDIIFRHNKIFPIKITAIKKHKKLKTQKENASLPRSQKKVSQDLFKLPTAPTASQTQISSGGASLAAL
jgi:hypothetical protein